MISSLEPNKAILIYDDQCLLCHYSLQFVLQRDGKDQFRFTNRHSSIAQKLVGSKMTESVVLVSRYKIYIKSRAAIKTFALLGGKWKLFSLILQLFPTFLADWVYNIIAKYRYQWFGKMTKCELLNPSWTKKIIS